MDNRKILVIILLLGILSVSLITGFGAYNYRTYGHPVPQLAPALVVRSGVPGLSISVGKDSNFENKIRTLGIFGPGIRLLVLNDGKENMVMFPRIDKLILELTDEPQNQHKHWIGEIIGDPDSSIGFYQINKYTLLTKVHLKKESLAKDPEIDLNWKAFTATWLALSGVKNLANSHMNIRRNDAYQMLNVIASKNNLNEYPLIITRR